MRKSKNFMHNLLKTFKLGSSKEGQGEEDWERIAAQEQKHFAFDALVAATKDFHPTHKLGEGGFGPVFRGKLEDGREIAVKKLSHSSNQGKKEFTNEAKLLARVQHRNVVNLLGYCAHGAEKLLVYEYVPNESLDKLLFKSNSKKELLDWKRRFDIIAGIARGLLYLHEDSHSCIIHRDIKASNILLDDKWAPKIADFGMARLFPEGETHVNTRVAGTNGYMAPEYVMHGSLSKAADVYSFGVVVLELITGQRNSSFNLDIDAQNMLDWAYKMYKKGKSLEIVDTALASSASADQVAMCIQIGLLCTQGDPHLRPTMGRVVVLLSKKPGNLDEPITRPGLPGTRYRRSRRPHGLSGSTGTTSGTSSTAMHSFGSGINTRSATQSTATTTTMSSLPSPSDPHGKRPMQS